MEDKIYFTPYNVGKCLDIAKETVRYHITSMNSLQVIKLTNNYISNVCNTNFRKLHNTGENFITLGGLFKLIFALCKTVEISMCVHHGHKYITERQHARFST